MDWKEYFHNTRGAGYLATANAAGEVNVAVYSRPHVLEDGRFAFGMTDRLTHANLMENPHAAYAFRDAGFHGVRVYLRKVGEETDGPLLDEIRASADRIVGPGTGSRVTFVVYFEVLRHLPLVGT